MIGYQIHDTGGDDRRLCGKWENRPFGASRCSTWLHKGVTSFDEMTNLSKGPAGKAGGSSALITAPEVARKQVSRPGRHDQIPLGAGGRQLHRNRADAAITTGTRCASPPRWAAAWAALSAHPQSAGKVRDLTACRDAGSGAVYASWTPERTVSNIVLMGIGEPMDNLDNVLRFLELVNHPDGLNIGMRHISLSTCGVIPGIAPSGGAGAAADAVGLPPRAGQRDPRRKSCRSTGPMTWTSCLPPATGISEKTGRRISFEYAMIDGVNDHDWQADLIATEAPGHAGPCESDPAQRRGGESAASPPAGWRHFSSGWSPTGSPPQCAGAWGAISTPPAGSCGEGDGSSRKEERSSHG